MSTDAEKWEQIYRDYPLNELGWELGKPRPILVEFVEGGSLRKGKVLDICCGAGTNTVYLAEKGFQVTGMDISPTAIKFAKIKATHSNVKIRLLVQDFLRLPFDDGEFDFVFDMGCFHHVKPQDRTMFIEGVNRVLKKGGTFMLTCFSYRNGSAWNHFAKEQLIGLFFPYFRLGEFRHYPSVEGDGVTRYFYTVVMKKK